MARIVFIGTPAFAVPSLQGLAREHTLVGVVTQPDLPAGRGQQLSEPDVKAAAHRLGVPVIQPRRLREPEALAQLRAWAPELIVVAAFGQILRPEVLELPPHGCLNVHASLLPRFRGAAPIVAAILAGDAETGVTIMRMDVGLDTGPTLADARLAIQRDDTALTLAERLSILGAGLLLDVIPPYLAGHLTARPQAEDGALYAPQLVKEAGRLNFTRPADYLERQVRAFTPWPGTFAVWPEPSGGPPRSIKVLRAEALEGTLGPPGQVFETRQGPAVTAAVGALLLLEVQPPGKRPMPAADFARGAREFIGAQLL
ncbi:MAG: methionyl-tRNA formyltransferase [Anaerolineales bacterium]